MTDDDQTTEAIQAAEPVEPVAPESAAPAPVPVVPPQVPEPASQAAEVVPPAPPVARRPAVDKRMVLLGVLTGIAVMVLVLLGLMIFAPAAAPLKLGATSVAARAQQADDVEEVAGRFATSLYSFNYETIDDDLARIRADSTGSFSRELEQVLGEVDVFKKAIVDARGRSTGEVEGIDVRDIEGDTATARVFVIQSITNKKNPTPRQQFSAVELTMVKTSGGWKIDDVQQFQSGDPGASATDGSGQ